VKELALSRNYSFNHLFEKASKMTETKVKVLDQQGSESAYSDPKTNANTLSPTTVTTHRLHGLSRCKQQIQHSRAEQMANNSDRSSSVQQFDQFCKQVLFWGIVQNLNTVQGDVFWWKCGTKVHQPWRTL